MKKLLIVLGIFIGLPIIIILGFAAFGPCLECFEDKFSSFSEMAENDRSWFNPVLHEKNMQDASEIVLWRDLDGSTALIDFKLPQVSVKKFEESLKGTFISELECPKFEWACKFLKESSGKFNLFEIGKESDYRYCFFTSPTGRVVGRGLQIDKPIAKGAYCEERYGRP